MMPKTLSTTASGAHHLHRQEAFVFADHHRELRECQAFPKLLAFVLAVLEPIREKELACLHQLQMADDQQSFASEPMQDAPSLIQKGSLPHESPRALHDEREIRPQRLPRLSPLKQVHSSPQSFQAYRSSH